MSDAARRTVIAVTLAAAGAAALATSSLARSQQGQPTCQQIMETKKIRVAAPNGAPFVFKDPTTATSQVR